MYRIKTAVEGLNKSLEKYKKNKEKEKNNESMIELLKKINETECLFHNYLYDLLREFPEILHRRA